MHSSSTLLFWRAQARIYIPMSHQIVVTLATDVIQRGIQVEVGGEAIAPDTIQVLRLFLPHCLTQTPRQVFDHDDLSLKRQLIQKPFNLRQGCFTHFTLPSANTAPAG
jgi:hypothetical protein